MANAHDHSWSIDTPAVTAVETKATPRVLFLRLSEGTVPDSASLIADSLAGEGWTASVCSVSAAENVAASRGARPQRWKQTLARWRALFSALPAFDVVHIPCSSLSQVTRQALPALILTRFFGRKPILHFETADIETLLERHRRWLAPLLRLSGAAVTGSRHLQKILNRTGLSVRLLTPPVSLDGISHRIRGKLQPRILVNTPLEPDLNVQSSIRAFRLVKQKYPRAEMVIAGRGSQRHALESLVQQSRINGIEFRGEVGGSDLARLYQECDLFLHAPLIDESPQAMVKAFAAGLPVVASDADGLLHMVRDGVNALVAPMGDHTALADAILELVESQEICERLSVAGKIEAEKYIWSRVRQDWVNLYKSLVT